MIDKLVIQIPFAPDFVKRGSSFKESELIADAFTRTGVFWVPMSELPVKQGAKSIEWVEGELVAEDLYCPWESLASDHGGLALKVYEKGNGFAPWPYVELKCSPAKLAQGHNVWGWDNIRVDARNMFAVLAEHYPEFGVMLDVDAARVSEIHITYSARVPNPRHRKSFIQLLHTLSQGQTKARGDTFETTAYFGEKRSKLRRIKVYLKGPETVNDQADRKRRRKEPMPDFVMEHAREMVRVEAELKREWLDRRQIPTKLKDLVEWFEAEPGRYREIFGEVTKDMWKAIDGQEIAIVSDDLVYSAIQAAHGEVRGKPARVFGFYQAVRAVGLETLKQQYNERTYRRMVFDLESAGFSRAVLGNLHKGTAQIVQVSQFINLGALDDHRPKLATQPKLYAVAA